MIREIHKDEVVLLKDFLYEAIYIPEGVTPPPRSILKQSELRVYIDDFGSRKGDHCLVADCGGKLHPGRLGKQIMRRERGTAGAGYPWGGCAASVSAP